MSCGKQVDAGVLATAANRVYHEFTCSPSVLGRVTKLCVGRVPAMVHGCCRTTREVAKLRIDSKQLLHYFSLRSPHRRHRFARVYSGS